MFEEGAEELFGFFSAGGRIEQEIPNLSGRMKSDADMEKANSSPFRGKQKVGGFRLNRNKLEPHSTP